MTGDLPEPLTFRRLEITAVDRPVEAVVSCEVEPGVPPRLLCAPLALPFADGALSEIRIPHLIQYFRKADAAAFLRECRRVLEPGGTIHLIAADLNYYSEQYPAASHGLALAELRGDQTGPGHAHQWGYNRQSLCDLLMEAGFVRVQDLTASPPSLQQHDRHLEARARKHAPRTAGDVQGRIAKGRQVAATIDGIRSDHVERYHFAAQFVSPGDVVLDCACGVGYGTYLLATETQLARITGVDIDPEAVAFARAHFPHDKATFVQGDCLDESLALEPADCVVSFETLEHVPRDLQFLARLRALLKPQGTLLISSPNEEVFPYSEADAPHHVRHYTSAELRDVLQRAGLRVISEVSQDAFEITPGFGRRFNTAVCRRDDALASEQFQVPCGDARNSRVADPRDQSIASLRAENARLAQELRKHAEALQRLRRNPVVRIARAVTRALRRARAA